MNDDPIRTDVVHHDDASIQYVITGPTEGSLRGPIDRITASFQRADVVIGSPCMVRGEFQVTVSVFR